MVNFKFRGFLRLFVPFVLVQALGIYAASKFLPSLGSLKPADLKNFSFYDFLILLVFLGLFIFLSSKFKKIGTIFYRVILTILIFSGAQTILVIWFGPMTSILISILLVFLFWFFRNVLMQNISMILTLAGIGAVLSLSLAPTAVLLILIIFSFYDIIAVYKTGHMVKLAESMIKSQAIFGFVIPNFSGGLKEHLSKVVPGEEFMILGSGDVIFPLLLSASLVRISLIQAVTVAIFSGFGLLAMFWLFSRQKVRRPMAALPPIAGMSIIGYLISQLF